jgi:type I site-specific restriction endonuclease
VTRQETPEKAARVNLHAGRGVAVREFKLNSGHGSADCLLYVDGGAIGVIEAKREGAKQIEATEDDIAELSLRAGECHV